MGKGCGWNGRWDPRVEVTPQTSITGTRSRPGFPGAVTRLPRWIHSRLRALLPPYSVPHRRRPGWRETPARRRSARRGRRERSLVRLTSQGGRVRVIVPPSPQNTPLPRRPFQAAGGALPQSAVGDLGGDIWVVGSDRVLRVPCADSAPCRAPLHCPQADSGRFGSSSPFFSLLGPL